MSQNGRELLDHHQSCGQRREIFRKYCACSCTRPSHVPLCEQTSPSGDVQYERFIDSSHRTLVLHSHPFLSLGPRFAYPQWLSPSQERQCCRLKTSLTRHQNLMASP